jgi:hypothetical protein
MPGPADERPNLSGTLSFDMNAQTWLTASQQDRKILELLHEMTSKSRERLWTFCTSLGGILGLGTVED